MAKTSQKHQKQIIQEKLNALRKVKTEKRELIGWDGTVNVIEYLIGGDRSHGYNEALDDMIDDLNNFIANL